MVNDIGYYRNQILNYFSQSVNIYLAKLLTFSISFLIIYLLGRATILILVKITKNVISRHEFFRDSNILYFSERLLRKIVVISAFFGSVMLIESSQHFKFVTYRVYRITMIIIITGGLVGAMDVIFSAIKHIRKDRSEVVNEMVINFLSKLAKALIVIFAILMVLSELGVDVNGIVAGLGLGGVTFALAAKDTATNIFGGINIIMDKPFVVGDWIASGTIEGVVEDITFRSTRIRTFFDSMAIVPNSVLVNDRITNWSRMNKRRDKLTFGISYTTEKAKIHRVLKSLDTKIKEHENVLEDTVIVRLDKFAESSIDVEVIYFTDLLNMIDAKRIREEISFAIIDVLNEVGVDFAFPSRTIYMANNEKGDIC